MGRNKQAKKLPKRQENRERKAVEWEEKTLERLNKKTEGEEDEGKVEKKGKKKKRHRAHKKEKEMGWFERGEQLRKKIVRETNLALDKKIDNLTQRLKDPSLSFCEKGKRIEDLEACLSQLELDRKMSAVKVQLLRQTDRGYLKSYELGIVERDPENQLMTSKKSPEGLFILPKLRLQKTLLS